MAQSTGSMIGYLICRKSSASWSAVMMRPSYGYQRVYWIDQVLQLQYDMTMMGYGHFFVHLNEGKDCDVVGAQDASLPKGLVIEVCMLAHTKGFGAPPL